MALNVWTQPSGYNLGIYNERQKLNISLPVSDPVDASVTFKIISGKIPNGVRVEGTKIVGTGFEVPRTTDYKFVIRASNGTDISDRTFTMTLVGADEPIWITPEGLLPVGTNNAFYVIDSSFIDFNLNAIDADTPSGQTLNYFIASGNGELPPGLILLPNGRITGFIEPLLKTPLPEIDNGYYDSGGYDGVSYDFGYRSSNGYDSFLYDSVTYDFNLDSLNPRKLNRFYEFIATVTDGDTVIERTFKIYVVGDDFFRADNIIMQAGEGTFTADVTYVKAPIFTTPKYLGLRRANNYLTFKIDIYEDPTVNLQTFYELAPANALISGLSERSSSSENRAGTKFLRFIKSSNIPQIGYKINFNEDFTNATNKTYTVVDVEVLGTDFYRVELDLALDMNVPNGVSVYLGPESELPPGMDFDVTSGEVVGAVPYQPSVTKTYTFTVKAQRFGEPTLDDEGNLAVETTTSRRMFTVDILGEVDSAISWNTPEDLGEIDAGFPSSLFVKATTIYQNPSVLYFLESGQLPPGLSLNFEGEIVGKVNQLRDQNVYKGFWKPTTTYNEKDIVKRDITSSVRSLIRRKNIATLVTNESFEFENNSIVEISTNNLSFNYPSGTIINVDKHSLKTVSAVSGTGPYRVTFDVSRQDLEPLAPLYTLIKGTSGTADPFGPIEVDVKSTSGTGVGARFIISKADGTIPLQPELNNFNYVGLIAGSDIIMIDAGTGYEAGDTITISGADLPSGTDGINDLTFTLLTGLDFNYKVNGNSNPLYNGIYQAVSSSRESITLLYDTDPGEFGTGLISQITGTSTYEAQTQLVPLNYFNYSNAGPNKLMKVAEGSLIGVPEFYIAKDELTTGLTFNTNNWKRFRNDVNDKSPTTIDGTLTTFDSLETTIDREFTFTVSARDVANYTEITRTFTLKINIPQNLYYSNITAKPMLKIEQREMFKDFINSNSIFDPTLIYRLGDANFGVRRDLATLIYAGIETKEAVEYISAVGYNNKRKRFNMGNVKKAVAKTPGTNNVEYEVVYVELLDPLESNGKHLPYRIATQPKNKVVTIDNTNDFYNIPNQSDPFNPYFKRPDPFAGLIDRRDIIAGDAGTGVKFPSSISIWRKRLKEMENTRDERNYLPLWMRSIQEGSFTELDYVPALVLCYCKPGSADDVLLNIKNSDFDFKLLDYTLDRYIIDSVEGYYEDKYLVFRNDRTQIA